MEIWTLYSKYVCPRKLIYIASNNKMKLIKLFGTILF